MGNCLGSPAQDNYQKKTSEKAAAAAKPVKREGSGRGEKPRRTTAGSRPDFGLGGDYVLVKHLGKGGTGDTWLCKNPKTQALVAIKFIKRPLPRVLMPNILREFTVSI